MKKNSLVVVAFTKCVFDLEVVKAISLIDNPLASRGGVLFERAKRSEFYRRGTPLDNLNI